MAQPKFIFPLQPLLEHRRRIEKDHMRIVSNFQNQANNLLTQIQTAQQSIRSENQNLSAQHLVGRLNLAFIATEKRYVGSLQMIIAVTAQKLAAVEQQLAIAKTHLLLAAKARKVIDKLREKQHARWQTEINRKEADFLDEIGTQLALRKMLEEEPSF